MTSTARQSAAMALNAGCDLNCGNTYLYMMGAYQDGLVTEEKITESAVRLLTTRYLLGLFDGSEYDKIFQLEVMYDFYESRGLPRHTIGIVKNLSIGNECVIASKDAIRIKRLSKSFYYIEEHNQ